MVTSEHRHRLAWFIPLRLATFVILFFAVVAWMGFPSFLRIPFLYYAGVTLAFTFLLAFDKQQRLRNVTATAVVLHFLTEIAIESGVVYATGNVNSPFAGLFILTIVSAALAYRLVGTLLMASAVSVAYTFVIWLGLTNNDPVFSLQALRTIFNADQGAFYSILLHILIFYLVAFMAGYLAEKLRHQDRRLADASLALRRARLETDDILRHLNSGLITVDADGRVVYFNRAAERILGYREEDVKGLPCSEVFAERMPNLAASLTDGIRKKVAHIRHEIEILNGNGVAVPIGLSISILTEEDHSTRGVIAIFSDLTEAKALEAKVRTADRLAAIGELSASIAHEIRNPLAAISGSVEVLKADLDVGGENARLLELIVKESDRLTVTLNEFLQYARIDRPVYGRVDLCHLVGDVVYLLRHHDSYAESVDLRFEADQAVAYALGDENLIKQLLLNLGVNACEATRETGGGVAFKILTREPDLVTLRVEDTGCGMTEEQLRRVYEPFYSTKKQGTGLGLAIVHRICSVLNLTLNLRSTAGQGTTFIIGFPVSTTSSDTAVRNVAVTAD